MLLLVLERMLHSQWRLPVQVLLTNGNQLQPVLVAVVRGLTFQAQMPTAILYLVLQPVWIILVTVLSYLDHVLLL